MNRVFPPLPASVPPDGSAVVVVVVTVVANRRSNDADQRTELGPFIIVTNFNFGVSGDDDRGLYNNNPSVLEKKLDK